MRLLNTVGSWLNSMHGKAAAVAITIRRGADVVAIEEADEAAWVGAGSEVSQRDGSTRIEWKERDYLILASAMGLLSEPREGDRIIETINGVQYTFKVFPMTSGEPAWRWSDDATRTCYRVHVKQVK